MKKLKLTGKELRAIGFPEGPVISVAMKVMEKNYRFHTPEEAMAILKSILQSPAEYAKDDTLGTIARQLLPEETPDEQTISLNQSGIAFNIFGREHIEEAALHQMYQAARLPVSVAGALMPDAHSGYGLPIGGVLATTGAVIPYGVGVDIGCRMCLSLFDVDPVDLEKRSAYFSREIGEASLFGSGAQFKEAADHPIMENTLFQQLPLLKGLHGRAWKQLGTSGSGNHFVEFGEVQLKEKDEVLGVEPGNYLGLLSHSGSRGLGASIANHYTRIAISKRRLPNVAKNLAWLDLTEEAGIEYWLAMNLAGDYASACHHIIHDKIAKQLGRRPLRRVENHHNFAWKEVWNGQEVIVHRKGATPAGKDVLGVIPGSMAAPGYIVRGKGEPASINSAAHGAGRKMSRSKAIASITEKQMREELQRHGVQLLGGGLDEAPFAYKNIEEVMRSQQTLVAIVGKFIPKIVKMDGSPHRGWRTKDKELMGE